MMVCVDKAPISMCWNDLQNILNIDEVCVRLVDNALFFIRRDLVRGDGCAEKYFFYTLVPLLVAGEKFYLVVL